MKCKHRVWATIRENSCHLEKMSILFIVVKILNYERAGYIAVQKCCALPQSQAPAANGAPRSCHVTHRNAGPSLRAGQVPWRCVASCVQMRFSLVSTSTSYDPTNLIKSPYQTKDKSRYWDTRLVAVALPLDAMACGWPRGQDNVLCAHRQPLACLLPASRPFTVRHRPDHAEAHPLACKMLPTMPVSWNPGGKPKEYYANIA